MSCVLFHGPGARQEALNTAVMVGRLVSPPLGDEGLKIGEVREVIETMLSAPVGMETGVVVLGPMDHPTVLQYKAGDGLLKIIEEPPGTIQPLLWAYDLWDVSATIRSRCLPRWCPVSLEEDEELEGDGRALVDAVLEGRLWKVPGLVKKHDKKLPELLGVAANGILSGWNADAMALWEKVRRVALHRNPTVIEVVSAFMPEPKG